MGCVSSCKQRARSLGDPRRPGDAGPSAQPNPGQHEPARVPPVARRVHAGRAQEPHAGDRGHGGERRDPVLPVESGRYDPSAVSD